MTGLLSELTKRAVPATINRIVRLWWNGIHNGLKIRRRKLGGSNPPSRTTSERVRLVPIFYFIKNLSPASLFLLSAKSCACCGYPLKTQALLLRCAASFSVCACGDSVQKSAWPKGTLSPGSRRRRESRTHRTKPCVFCRLPLFFNATSERLRRNLARRGITHSSSSL